MITPEHGYDASTSIVIGYGSLMSGYGLAMHGATDFAGGFPIFLENARRGFGKLARQGDRLAMVLDPIDPHAPIEAMVADDDARPALNAVGALALSAAPDALLALSRREGYPTTSLQRLNQAAAVAHLGLAEFLRQILDAADGAIAAYRRRLLDIAGDTSPHYIPHPIPLADGRTALTFLAPGREGTGDARVVPVRCETGIADPLSAAQAWEIKPNPSQFDYFLACLLGQRHGIQMHDLAAHALPGDVVDRLTARIAAEADDEESRLCAQLGLDRSGYAAIFRRSTRGK